MNTKAIVVLGSLNMDLVGTVRRLPRAGETLPGLDFYKTLGGKGANQAIACARLGGRVEMAGQVGIDDYGEELVEGLHSEGVGTTGISKSESDPTGIALITVEESGENTIVPIYGANMNYSSEVLHQLESLLKKASLLMLQNEIPMSLNIGGAEIAKTLGVPVIWDPAPGIRGTQSLASLATYVTPNQIEAGFLAGITVDNKKSAFEACDAIHSNYGCIPIITLGEEGVSYLYEGSFVHKDAIETHVVDTVGAGDAFAGGLSVSLSEGNSLDQAIGFGLATAALAVNREGAQTSMPFLEEVTHFRQANSSWFDH